MPGEAEFPEKLQCLFEPWRYIVLWGGRGGAKSWGIARASLIQGAERKKKILCAREIQKSIADSVHALLESQIHKLNLEKFYTIQKAGIFGKNGTEYLFAGLKHNIANIKSIEDVDDVWVEEAQTVSKSSWDVLIPTIRKPGSRIIASFNPELETDDTYKRFVLAPPPNSKVVKIGYQDNPWFPDVLEQERIYLQQKDPDAYEHVWEGMCRQVVEGAVYRTELLEADKQGRICRVPYDPIKPVDTFWDLGFSDSTCIWFAQSIGFEFRVIDYVEGSQQALQFYFKKLQDKPYVYGKHHLPHDAKAHQLGSGRSVEEQMRDVWPDGVIVLPRLSIEDGIAAARAIFPKTYFDGENCSDGIQALRHYRYEIDEKLGTLKKQPLHDWASHAADAFRQFAVAIKEPERQREEVMQIVNPYGNAGWMA